MKYEILEKIKSPKNLKNLSIDDLKKLSFEVRDRIITVLSKNGGHLSSNLGIVEITIALHRVFNSPTDKFIFDTSHQTYCHKILTERNKDFDSIRQLHGLCGFAHPFESTHDPFFLGHSGTSLSLSMGLAKSRDLKKQNHHVISILGDGSLTCGLTLEALNNISKNTSKFIVILNDNKMSISQNVGNIKNILSRFLSNPISNKLYYKVLNYCEKIPAYGCFIARQIKKLTASLKTFVSPASFFEQFGFYYTGPIDGHDIKKIITTLEAVKNQKNPILLQILTTKGKGMPIAMANPTPYHGVKPFNLKTGKLNACLTNKKTFSQIFGESVFNMMSEDDSIIALSPAMIAGSGLINVKKKFPERCIDVGIAEGHCITYAGGLAKNNKVIVCIYSTFLQRAFDNVFHDICLQELSIIIAIDRAGINGKDGVTHHGIYDIGFLYAMPNMVIAQPRNGFILNKILKEAFNWNCPVAIRYPNKVTSDTQEKRKIFLGKGQILFEGEKKIIIISLGDMYKTAMQIKDNLQKHNIIPTIIDPIFIKPLDKDLFLYLIKECTYILTIEEHNIYEGFASIFNTFLVENKIKDKIILNCGIKDAFLHHGDETKLKEQIELDADSITNKILKIYSENYEDCIISK